MQPESTSEPKAEFLRTDARQRRNLVLLIVGLLVFAIVFFSFGLPALTAWLLTGYTDTALHKFALVSYSIAGLVLIVGACVAGYARRVFRSGQFPPAGTWVFKDTRLLRGAAARMWAWGAVGVAAFCALLAVYVVMQPHLLRERLLPPAPANGAHLQSTKH